MTHLQLFVTIDNQPVLDPAVPRLCGSYTRSPATVNFTHPEGGKYATYFGRGVSARGETSGFSSPATMRIAA